MITLRPYQQAMIDDARLAYRRGKRAVLFQLPTGGGKTVTASTVVHGAAQKGNRTWWLTHRRELASQASETFHNLGIPHGTVQAGYVSNPDATVQVASIQTISRRLDTLPPPSLIVFDECIAGDSIVETDRGPMPIRDIKADGIRALCQIDGRLEFRTISKAWKSGNRETLKISLSNGNVLICTPEHRIYLDGQWTEARNLKINSVLASPAAFASADAAGSSRGIPVGASAKQSEVTLPGGRGSIGMPALPRSSQRLHCVRADAVGKLLHSHRGLSSSVNGSGAVEYTPASSLVTKNGQTGMGWPLPNSSGQLFSARCSETAASAYPTLDLRTRVCRGRTENHKPLGFTTRARLFGGSGPWSTLLEAPGSVMSALGCTLRASLASLKSATSFLLTALSGSRANGLTLLAMPGSRGGIATMAIGPTQYSSTPRDSQRAKTKSSPIGSVQLRSSTISAAGRISASTKPGHWKLSNASARSCRTAWDTNCPRIERIEAGPAIDVYDLTVDEAHNFFANGVLVHNCHHIGAASWEAIFNRYPEARILGLTATPWRLDGLGMGRWFGHMVNGPTTADLIKNGSLSPYRLFAPAIPDLAGVGMAQGDYQRGALAKAMDKPAIVGDAIGHYLKLCSGKRAVAFAAGVENSKNIAAQFNAAGVPAEHVDGAMTSEARDAAVDRFKRGETLVLCNADLFGEGFDVPAIEAAILLRPTKSLSLHLQQVGRALRPCPGKTEAIILDHAGNSLIHGLPDDDRVWSMEDREKKKRAEKSEVPVRQCEECFYVYRPAPKCPQCGHAPEVKAREIEVVEGTLSEVKRIEDVQKRREVGKASTLDDFMRIARERGYKPGWAHHMMRVRSSQGRAYA